MKNLRVVGALVALFLLVATVRGHSLETKPLLDIPALALKSPEQVEKVVGKHRHKEEATSPENSPGELRTYNLKTVPKAGLTVRYRYSQAVSITVDFLEDSPLRNDPEALPELFGFDATEMKIEHRNRFAIRWSGEYRGVKWKQLSILVSDGQVSSLNAIAVQS
jgi:hypothetical protein